MSARPRDPASRLRWMHDRLLEAYGPQSWWPAQSRFEVVLGAYLTQNTSWKAVERSLANLATADALSPEGFRTLSLDQLREFIRPSGFVTRKAPALRAFMTLLDKEFEGSLDKLAASCTEALRARLLALPGVGPETADAILLYALGHAVPVADEYLRRVVGRHGLVVPAPAKSRAGYETLVQLTRDSFDAELETARFFNEFHALTVAVGKTHCRKRPLCEGCPLAADLPPCGPFEIP